MGNGPTLSNTWPYLLSGWVPIQGNGDLGSVRDFFIVLYLMWSKRIWRQGESTPVVEIPSSDRVALGILSNINNRAPPRKQPTAPTRCCCPKKAPPPGHRLVYEKMVEALPDYKRFNLWWFDNTACGDPTESNWIENILGHVSLRLVWRKRGEWEVQFSVCGWRAFRWWG